MARQAIDRTIRRYVAAGSDLANTHVIPSKRKGPSQPDAYATVLIFEDAQRGIGETSDSGTGFTKTRTTRHSRRITASVQWLRDGSGGVAERFEQWASSPDGREWARDHGLTFQECSAIRDLSAIWGDAYEERWGLDLTVDVISEFADSIGTVGSIDVDVDVRI